MRCVGLIVVTQGCDYVCIGSLCLFVACRYEKSIPCPRLMSIFGLVDYFLFFLDPNIPNPMGEHHNAHAWHACAHGDDAASSVRALSESTKIAIKKQTSSKDLLHCAP